MSNTSKGRGSKGSKFWMQVVVEYDHLRNELDEMIGEHLVWLSPLAGEDHDFLEYELKQPYVYERLGMTKEQCDKEFSFWPGRQPQWDGLAISEDGKTLYLVEAKAHLSELNSKISASSEVSREKITEAMKTAHDTYYPSGVFDKWMNGYYQLGNRLTFLKKMQGITLPEIKRVKLVLLNFVNDTTYNATSKLEWREHYKNVWKVMTGIETAPDDVIEVDFEVSEKGVVQDPETGEPILSDNA